jgi:hypothetical protein
MSRLGAVVIGGGAGWWVWAHRAEIGARVSVPMRVALALIVLGALLLAGHWLYHHVA